MKTKKELPLVEPVYSTYQEGIFSACITDNPTIRNFYLNEVMILKCNRKFLTGYTTPEIGVVGTAMNDNPYLMKHWVPMCYLKGYINIVIRNMIDAGYYIYFWGVDDYYVEGKSWYRERHFNHDGTICGYNQEDKTYCIYAYDANWINQKFWTPQKAFDRGREACIKNGIQGFICGIKPKMETVVFSAGKALNKIMEYLDSDKYKYPENEEGTVYGIEVQEYIAKYIGKLYDGSIPYEKMDRRVFRMIWEHKKLMHERIEHIEEELGLDPDISIRYEQLVQDADSMRMLYALYNEKRRDSILPIIQQKLVELKNKEFGLLRELLDESRIVFKLRYMYDDRNYRET